MGSIFRYKGVAIHTDAIKHVSQRHNVITISGSNGKRLTRIDCKCVNEANQLKQKMKQAKMAQWRTI